MNTANKITLTRIILVPIFILFITPIPVWAVNKYYFLHEISHYSVYIATFIFVIAAITDKLDGYIARKYNQITKLGKLLDPLADKLMVCSALILLVERNQLAVWMAILIIGREYAVTSIRVIAAADNKILAADKFGKIKMVVQVVAIVLALLRNYPINLITKFPVDKYMMIFAVIATVYSGINYMIKNKEVIYTNGKFVV